MLWWLLGAAAAAAPQQGGGSSVELLRYVTPYATGLDVLVDVSAYAPLLLARGGPLKLYSFVDTWVGNNTKPEVWSDREGTEERCELRVLEGNGWALHAELLFFAREGAAGGAVVGAVAPAPFGAPLELGALEVATGRITGAATATVDGRALRAPRDAEAFWPCRSPEDVQRALRAGWARAQPANATRDVLLRRALAAPRRVAAVDAARRTARVELEAGDTGWGVGDAVYLEKRMAVLTDSGEAVNGVAPLDPVGRVVERDAGAATVELDAPGCLPELGWELRTAEPTEPPPHRAPARWVGKRAEIQALDGADGSLCVAAAAASPLVADTAVELGAPLAQGERARVRVTVTGHGWSFTAEHCGEYCQIEYTLLLDGAVAGRFRPWRDDCGENPLGSRQHGTWKESRNGWCPGAVSDGWWADVTELVQRGGRVRVALEALVIGEPAYNNSAGFAFDERAVVQAAVTFFREPPAPRQAGVVRRAKAAAPAGAAPWFSYLAEAEPPQHRVSVFSGELHQAGSRVLERAVVLPVGLDASAAWDVALHLHLAAPPPPLQVDRWDRFATFGVRI